MKDTVFIVTSLLLVFGLLLLVGPSRVNAAQTVPPSQDSLKDAYAPFLEFIQITPSDVTTYSPPLRGCIVEVAGDLTILPIKNASSMTLTVSTSQLVPVMISKVLASTTAVVACGR